MNTEFLLATCRGETGADNSARFRSAKGLRIALGIGTLRTLRATMGDASLSAYRERAELEEKTREKGLTGRTGSGYYGRLPRKCVGASKWKY